VECLQKQFTKIANSYKALAYEHTKTKKINFLKKIQLQELNMELLGLSKKFNFGGA